MVQETFLKAYRELRDSRRGRDSAPGSTASPPTAPSTPSAAGPKHVIAGKRRRGRAAARPAGEPGAGPRSPGGRAAAARADRGGAAGLTPLERAAFTLRHLEQRPVEEISGVLGQSPSATRHSIFRAVAKMRRELAPLVRTELMTHVAEEQLVAYALDDADEPARGGSRGARRRCARVPRGARRAARECSRPRPSSTCPSAAATTAPRCGRGSRRSFDPQGRARPRSCPVNVASVAGGRGGSAAGVGAFLSDAGRARRRRRVQAVDTATAVARRAIRERVVLAALSRPPRSHRARAGRAGQRRRERHRGHLGRAGVGPRPARRQPPLSAVGAGHGIAGARQLARRARAHPPRHRPQPVELSADEFHALRARIDDRSLVFKVRVTGADRARAPAGAHSSRRENVMIAVPHCGAARRARRPRRRTCGPVSALVDRSAAGPALQAGHRGASTKSDWDGRGEGVRRGRATKGERADAALYWRAYALNKAASPTRR